MLPCMLAILQQKFLASIMNPHLVVIWKSCLAESSKCREGLHLPTGGASLPISRRMRKSRSLTPAALGPLPVTRPMVPYSCCRRIRPRAV